MDDATPLHQSHSTNAPPDEAPAPSSEAIERLRQRVQQAVEEIDRLRAENERLRARIQELDARPAIGDDEAFVRLADDPEALRDQIEGFIETIDDYLNSTSNASD